MFTPSTLLQYVRDVAASATFYSGILGKPPVEQSPGFALFLLGDGAALGLWQRDDVQPPVSAQAGADTGGDGCCQSRRRAADARCVARSWCADPAGTGDTGIRPHLRRCRP